MFFGLESESMFDSLKLVLAGQQSEQTKCKIDRLIIMMCHHYTAGYVRRSFIGIITAKIKGKVILAKLTKLCKIFNHQPSLGYSLPIYVKEC